MEVMYGWGDLNNKPIKHAAGGHVQEELSSVGGREKEMTFWDGLDRQGLLKEVTFFMGHVRRRA